MSADVAEASGSEVAATNAEGAQESGRGNEYRKPFEELLHKLDPSEEFTTRQYAAHALAQMLVRDVRKDSAEFQLGLEYFRENDPAPSIVALGKQAEETNDVITLQLVCSCITNLAAGDGQLMGGREECGLIARCLVSSDETRGSGGPQRIALRHYALAAAFNLSAQNDILAELTANHCGPLLLACSRDNTDPSAKKHAKGVVVNLRRYAAQRRAEKGKKGSVRRAEPARVREAGSSSEGSPTSKAKAKGKARTDKEKKLEKTIVEREEMQLLVHDGSAYTRGFGARARDYCEQAPSWREYHAVRDENSSEEEAAASAQDSPPAGRAPHEVAHAGANPHLDQPACASCSSSRFHEPTAFCFSEARGEMYAQRKAPEGEWSGGTPQEELSSSRDHRAFVQAQEELSSSRDHHAFEGTRLDESTGERPRAAALERPAPAVADNIEVRSVSDGAEAWEQEHLEVDAFIAELEETVREGVSLGESQDVDKFLEEEEAKSERSAKSASERSAKSASERSPKSPDAPRLPDPSVDEGQALSGVESSIEEKDARSKDSMKDASKLRGPRTIDETAADIEQDIAWLLAEENQKSEAPSQRAIASQKSSLRGSQRAAAQFSREVGLGSFEIGVAKPNEGTAAQAKGGVPLCQSSRSFDSRGLSTASLRSGMESTSPGMRSPGPIGMVTAMGMERTSPGVRSPISVCRCASVGVEGSSSGAWPPGASCRGVAQPSPLWSSRGSGDSRHQSSYGSSNASVRRFPSSHSYDGSSASPLYDLSPSYNVHSPPWTGTPSGMESSLRPWASLAPSTRASHASSPAGSWRSHPTSDDARQPASDECNNLLSSSQRIGLAPRWSSDPPSLRIHSDSEAGGKGQGRNQAAADPQALIQCLSEANGAMTTCTNLRAPGLSNAQAVQVCGRAADLPILLRESAEEVGCHSIRGT
eukprot:CAMPEP_0205896898 /NCGR_PEP_ID=MMETSP1083-20121108/25206_1 /ASSEMBLY_ACC=CAM_ASM_000430 /TAXON_ID=97485 /ORGANISM="Prymnesium parvum, Strain Texoma1" /LENGTH=933 /DNA_ID=CAMNT_0053262015 /DNA_START=203 /DNA_END=3008 /DNA_ORIENTATION=-